MREIMGDSMLSFTSLIGDGKTVAFQKRTNFVFKDFNGRRTSFAEYITSFEKSLGVLSGKGALCLLDELACR
jgi:hypothetical protein